MKVFLTGGTGLVGRRLIRHLVGRGDEVLVLSRDPDAWHKVGQDVTTVLGDPTQPGDWQAQAAVCDAVVNLAGTNLFAKRWNDDVKVSLRDSRIRSTSNVVAALAKGPENKVLVNASAIGYYGPHGDEVLTEESPPGDDFLARLCIDWEAAALAAKSHGARVVLLRIGIVHDIEGGALSSLLMPFRMGLGGPLGMALKPRDWGKHYWSWIHHADLCGLILLALDNARATGPLNGVAPHPVTNKEFAKAFGKALGRPAWAPTPAIALKVLLGEVADILTTGQRVMPKKALDLGYQFRFPEIGPALADLLQKQAVAA